MKQPVIVELKTLKNENLELIEKQLQEMAPSFKIDIGYPIIPMQSGNNSPSYLIRGVVDTMQLNQLKSSIDVIDVFNDGSITPF
ncbi:MAG TPA: hypothetical protein VHM26_03425 [Chitinophagaceae bacterium]|nr:hypothetical protein [Chitinophagaceae bacterium]